MRLAISKHSFNQSESELLFSWNWKIEGAVVTTFPGTVTIDSTVEGGPTVLSFSEPHGLEAYPFVTFVFDVSGTYQDAVTVIDSTHVEIPYYAENDTAVSWTNPRLDTDDWVSAPVDGYTFTSASSIETAVPTLAPNFTIAILFDCINDEVLTLLPGLVWNAGVVEFNGTPIFIYAYVDAIEIISLVLVDNRLYINGGAPQITFTPGTIDVSSIGGGPGKFTLYDIRLYDGSLTIDQLNELTDHVTFTSYTNGPFTA